MRRIVEQSLFFVMVYSRWLDPVGMAEMRRVFLDRLPFPVRLIAPIMIKRKLARQLDAQGYGRRGRDGIYAQGIDDLKALALILGDKTFILGDRPSSVDAVLYGFLVNLIRPSIETPLKQAAQSLPVFQSYLERMDKLLAQKLE